MKIFADSGFIPRFVAIIKRYIKTKVRKDRKKVFPNTDFITGNLSKSVQILQPSTDLRQINTCSFNKHLLCAHSVPRVPGLFYTKDTGVNRPRASRTSNTTGCIRTG